MFSLPSTPKLNPTSFVVALRCSPNYRQHTILITWRPLKCKISQQSVSLQLAVAEAVDIVSICRSGYIAPPIQTCQQVTQCKCNGRRISGAIGIGLGAVGLAQLHTCTIKWLYNWRAHQWTMLRRQWNRLLRDSSRGN